jgi:hypothetical protein
MSRSVFALASVLGGFAFCVGCSGDTFRFYDVVKTTVEDCDILPSGEFCDPTGLPPPATEVWAVEVEDERTTLYIDGEQWVVEPRLEGADPADEQVAIRQSIDTTQPGPCTTTRDESITFQADASTLTGELRTRSRTEGGEACGETPRGLRSTLTLNGQAVGAP